MSIVNQISHSELTDLFLSLVALVIAFSILGARTIPDARIFLITAVGVGTGFLLHELAHKFVAMRYGYYAEYRASRVSLVLIVAMAFAGFIFAAPGAVIISRTSSAKEELMISLAGPMTNIILSIIFFLLLASGIAKGPLWLSAANFALFINLTLAAFNLLPFGPMDGKKIFDCNRTVWVVVGVPTILAALPVYLGMI